MKKNTTRGEERKRKPRRLSLSRETLQVLDSPELELAKGRATEETCPADTGTYSFPPPVTGC